MYKFMSTHQINCSVFISRSKAYKSRADLLTKGAYFSHNKGIRYLSVRNHWLISASVRGRKCESDRKNWGACSN